MSLELRDLLVRIGAGAPLNLVIPPGRPLVVTGGAGSGKSTLLRVLAGTRPPASGSVLLNGDPVRASDVGIVTQTHDLLGGLTSVENVALRALIQAGSRTRLSTEALTASLSALGLPESTWHNLVEQLSGGQQQRVALARALVGDPPLLCLDDPTSELDSATTDRVWDVVAGAAGHGAVVVVASDDPRVVARGPVLDLRLGACILSGSGGLAARD